MRKKILFIAFGLLAALLLSGCTGATAWPGLSADENTVYLANGTAVHAISLKDGQQTWQYPLRASSKLVFNSSPVVTPNGLVIFGSSGVDHSLFAIDPGKFPEGPVQTVGGLQRFFCSIGLASCPVQNKVEQWIFTGANDHWVASPLVVNDRVFAPNADGNLYVLDLADGSLLKKVTLGADSKGSNRLWSQPVTDGKRVFVTSLDRRLFGIDLETYEFWRQDVDGAIPGSAVLGSDGMLYIGSLDKQLERFDPATGQHESVLTANGWIWGTPIVDGDNLYFSDVEGYFYSYNTKEGKPNWKPVQPDGVSSERAITASPLIQDGRVLIATESGNIYSVSSDGQEVELWHQVEGQGKAYTTPVSAGGYVLVAYLESDYYLIALDQDGDKQWTFPTGK